MEVEESRSFVDKQRMEVGNMINFCNDSDVKVSLEKVMDALEYCDPVGTDATAECEDRIETQISQLNDSLLNGKSGVAIMRECNTIIKLIEQRNEICSSSKRR